MINLKEPKDASEKVQRSSSIAESCRASETLQLYKSNLLFIDFDERNIVRRIDLDDFRTNSLRLPVFMSNIATSKNEPIVYCLSRVSSTIYSLYIDISLLEIIESTKIESNTVRTGEVLQHSFSMLETGVDGLIAVVGEVAVNSNNHSNMVVVFNSRLKEIARKEMLLEGRGKSNFT